MKRRWYHHRKTPYRLFYGHKRSAKRRQIDFLLTFDEWWNLWQESGHWEERGRKRGQYVMARNGDVGPYAIGNVRITTVTDNCCEHTIGNKLRAGSNHTKETKQKISEGLFRYYAKG